MPWFSLEVFVEWISSEGFGEVRLPWFSLEVFVEWISSEGFGEVRLRADEDRAE